MAVQLKIQGLAFGDLPSAEKLPDPKCTTHAADTMLKEPESLVKDDPAYALALMQTELQNLEAEQALFEELLLLELDEHSMHVELENQKLKEEHEAQRSMLNSSIPASSAVAPSPSELPFGCVNDCNKAR